jgi:hypothetical protein
MLRRALAVAHSATEAQVAAFPPMEAQADSTMQSPVAR